MGRGYDSYKKLFLTVIADNTVHIDQVRGKWIHNICNMIKMTTDKERPSEKFPSPLHTVKSSFNAGIISREIAKQSRTAYNGVFFPP
jgi:hypothetical protein